ncbi:MAG: tRNA pseudouridine(55) synthase TruB [Gammaproteobacteria bacterium]
MGRRNYRNVTGVLLLDKPTAVTSNGALQQVKHLFQAKKAGHTGSLDPLATGLLPICLGEATKMSAFLLEADKYYQVRCRLGQKTETGDAEGTVVAERPVDEGRLAELESVLQRYRGEIDQIPPMYSALKKGGERLYKLAREGKTVEREPRRVTIHELTFLGREGEFLDLDVRCSKGTYVRTLVEDIGEELGCGAHVAQLRRLGVGPFGAENMVTLDQLQDLVEDQGRYALDDLLLPIDSAVTHWPLVDLDRDSAFYMRQGQPVMVPKAPTSGWVRLAEEGRFFGVGEVQDDGRIAPRRLFKLKPPKTEAKADDAKDGDSA